MVIGFRTSTVKALILITYSGHGIKPGKEVLWAAGDVTGYICLHFRVVFCANQKTKRAFFRRVVLLLSFLSFISSFLYVKL